MAKAFSLKEAQIQMTLAAISYAGDPPHQNIASITHKINAQLKNPSYASAGKWQCVWGPVIGSYGQNVIYVAQQRGSETYSLVIRGAHVPPNNWWEYTPDSKVDFSGVVGEACAVSDRFYSGFYGTLASVSNGETIQSFFARNTRGLGKLKLFVTGHGQGGGLVALYLTALLNMSRDWNTTNHPQIRGYAFASPTSGDGAFADWIENNTDCHFVTNPNDAIPCGYSRIDDILENGIPEQVPWELVPPLEAALKKARATGPWQHCKTQRLLARKELPPTDGSYLDGYLKQLCAHHDPNTYLALLDAPSVDFNTPTHAVKS